MTDTNRRQFLSVCYKGGRKEIGGGISYVSKTYSF